MKIFYFTINNYVGAQLVSLSQILFIRKIFNFTECILIEGSMSNWTEINGLYIQINTSDECHEFEHGFPQYRHLSDDVFIKWLGSSWYGGRKPCRDFDRSIFFLSSVSFNFTHVYSNVFSWTRQERNRPRQSLDLKINRQPCPGILF